MAHEISTSKLLQLVNDEETPDWLLRHFFEEDLENSRPFAPALRPRSNLVDTEAIDTLGGMESWNKRIHKKRRKRYRKVLSEGYEGPKIVSEGDSWFLYPVFVGPVGGTVWRDFFESCRRGSERSDLLSWIRLRNTKKERAVAWQAHEEDTGNRKRTIAERHSQSPRRPIQ